MIWNIIAYIIIGFIGGSIAKAIMPGKQGGGFWATALLGIVGAFVGGFLGGMLLDSSYTSIFSIAGLITSIIGALVVLFIY
ncbi:MAG: GlsB/YeaQ/YmgE family stress response membrane protein, partial [Propionibacterium sp.]|nr:GlsB/YeaQ/YmgE family stress response membrane protein [Propionibacterium sp.]